MPDLLKERRLRQEVHALDLADSDLLESDCDLKRAYLVLSMVSAAYIFAVGEEVAKVLPKVLAIPLAAIAERLGMNPVASYASVVLWNCFTPAGPIANVEDIICEFTFTGLASESWFYKVHAAMEAKGARALECAVLAMEGANAHDAATVLANLTALHDSLGQVTDVMGQMQKGTDIDDFVQAIRPYLGSWHHIIFEGVTSKVRTRIDRVSGKHVRYKCSLDVLQTQIFSGGTGGQSPLFQAFDIVLGVLHTDDFYVQMRPYFFKEHRRFVCALEKGPSIRVFAVNLVNEGTDEVAKAYNLCLERLCSLRNAHISLAHKYLARLLTGTGK
ncbi:hypothetical protein HDU93_006795 [Gonapodya sp. JEL0774]|nr:hypothetical protein HDU93_006795 [Gonapodya sp. JEL0774]